MATPSAELRSEGVLRRSIAMYYYTDRGPANEIREPHNTLYKGHHFERCPGERWTNAEIEALRATAIVLTLFQHLLQFLFPRRRTHLAQNGLYEHFAFSGAESICFSLFRAMSSPYRCCGFENAALAGRSRWNEVAVLIRARFRLLPIAGCWLALRCWPPSRSTVPACFGDWDVNVRQAWWIVAYAFTRGAADGCRRNKYRTPSVYWSPSLEEQFAWRCRSLLLCFTRRNRLGLILAYCDSVFRGGPRRWSNFGGPYVAMRWPGCCCLLVQTKGTDGFAVCRLNAPWPDRESCLCSGDIGIALVVVLRVTTGVVANRLRIVGRSWACELTGDVTGQTRGNRSWPAIIFLYCACALLHGCQQLAYRIGYTGWGICTRAPWRGLRSRALPQRCPNRWVEVPLREYGGGWPRIDEGEDEQMQICVTLQCSKIGLSFRLFANSRGQ